MALNPSVAHDARARIEMLGVLVRTGTNVTAVEVAAPQDSSVSASDDVDERKDQLPSASIEFGGSRSETHFITSDVSLRRPAVEALAHQRAMAIQEVEDASNTLKAQNLDHVTPGLVHDFNNFLASIVSCLRLLQGEVERENLSGVRHYLDAAHGAAQRATSLTRKLLDFSRPCNEGAKRTDISALIKGLQVLIQVAVAPVVRLDLQVDQNAGAALVDPSQLENVILNLCINARDAMRNGGVVTITTLREDLDEAAAAAAGVPPGQFVSLSVSDTGAGICPDIMERIFEPFFTTQPAGQGTGLGLSALKAFATQTEGYFKVESTIGQGTTMRLYIPRHNLPSEIIDTVGDPT